MEPSTDLLLSVNRDVPGGFLSASRVTSVGGDICTVVSGLGM